MKNRSLFLWISLPALLLALAAFLYLGIYTRPFADDYCIAEDVLQLGLPGMLVRWYTTWTGRFSFITSAGLLSLGGPRFAGLASLLTGLAWLCGLWWAYLPLLNASGWPRPRLLASLAAGLSLLALLSSIPNFVQSFFWQNGMANYTLPLIGFTFSGGILLRAWLGGIKPVPAGIALFFLAFASGGFTESFNAMQVTLFLLLLLALLLVRDKTARRRLLPVLGLALLGGLVSMLVVIMAPGNAIRLQYAGSQAGHPGLLRVITFSLRNMTHILGKYLLVTPLWALASILPPFLAGWLFTSPAPGHPKGWTVPWLWRESWFRGAALTGMAMIALVTAACAPVVFALNAYPDDRTIIVPQFVIVLAAVTVSAMTGAGSRKLGWLPDPAEKPILTPFLAGAILAVVLIASGFSLSRSIGLIPEFQSAARSWDQREAAIRQAGADGRDTLSVDGGDPFFGLPNLSDDPNNWVNKCAADYYGFKQILGR